MKVDGKCHCGELRFTGEIDPERVAICHCSDCQSLSASAYRIIVPMSGDAMKLLTGSPAEYVKIAESGNKRIQAFCKSCGTALWSCNAVENPTAYSVRVGALEQREKLVPKIEIWTRSALPWLPEIADTTKFEKSAS